MRNLSKVLALVLSLAFVMTMFSGALYTGKTYSDDADITSAAGKEAITVLSALDIIGGRTDGTYDPTGDVQRQEFAKMITIATTGEATGNFYNAAVPFVDAVAEWALPYVSYCYLNGIMVGHGNNVADAFGNVTGVQAAKMTLVALGYNPKAEGLEGANWKANTIKLAANIGLLKNLEGYNMDAALNREGTAILVYNAIYTNVAGSKLTLGEKVFDLLDTYAILVANENAALGVNWSDVMVNDNVAVSTYKQYEVAAKGQSVFVYRDYTGAATVGGYYVPRAITVNLTSGKADLGMAYRVLTTGAQNPTNTNEVRKLYAVLGEVEDSIDYVSAVKTADTEKVADQIDKMVIEAAKATAGITAADTQNNCFLNGKAVSYQAIKDWEARNEQSTAPFRYVDFDKDGNWDFVSASDYTLGYVSKVTEDSYVINGIGTVKIADAGVELVEGDYVARSLLDGVAAYRKLDAITGVVTAVDNNTNNDAIEYTYTVNNDKKLKIAFASMLLDNSDEAYVQQMIGRGTAAINAATLKYIVDGNWIVYVETTAETKWNTYGVLVGIDGNDILGLPQVQIYTEDNEYKNFVVTSFNGEQNYDFIVNAVRLGQNKLVKMYVNGYQVALYDYNDVETNDQHAAIASMTWDGAHNIWIDNGTQIPYTWDNGLVYLMNTAGDIKAYYPGELNDWASLTGSATIVFASENNNFNTLKVALINIGNQQLPGLVLREGQAIWGTVMSVTSAAWTVDENGKDVYTFTANILNPWSTGTTAVTVTADSPRDTFVVGNVYKMYTEDGVNVRRWEYVRDTAADLGDVADTNDYIDLNKVAALSLTKAANGTYLMGVNVPNNFGAIEYITIPADADIYFVKNLFSTSIEAVDYLTLQAVNGNIDTVEYVVYADYNADGTVASLWIDTADRADEWVVNREVQVTLSYDNETRTATYTVAAGALADGSEWTREYTLIDTDVDPDDLKMLDGQTKMMTVQYTQNHITGVYEILGTTSAAILEPTLAAKAESFGFGAANPAQNVIWGSNWNFDISTDAAHANLSDWFFQHDTQVYWVRDNLGVKRVEKLAIFTNTPKDDADWISSTDPGDFYETLQDNVAGMAFADLYFDADNDANNEIDETAHENAYDYEQIIVIPGDVAGEADMVILVDLNTADAQQSNGTEDYPYVAPEAQE